MIYFTPKKYLVLHNIAGKEINFELKQNVLNKQIFMQQIIVESIQV